MKTTKLKYQSDFKRRVTAIYPQRISPVKSAQLEDNKTLVSGVNVLLFENFVFLGNLSDFVETLSESRRVNARTRELIIGTKSIYKTPTFNSITRRARGPRDVYLARLY